MASYYKKKGSPYYWLRVQRADLTWGDEPSGIRHAKDGALREVTQRVNELSAQEALMKDDGSKAMMHHWVPAWMNYAYKNKGTLKRYVNAWAWVALFFKKRKVFHPAEVTYALCHEFMVWRLDPKRAKEREMEGLRAKVSRNTALLELRVLGAVMQEAVARGLITANPCARLGLSRGEAKEKREIPRDEEQRIQADLDAKPQAKWMGEAFLMAMRMGCRLSECKVPMSRVNEKDKLITIRAKRGKLYTAPLHKDLLPLVARAREEGRKFLVDVPEQASSRFTQFFERKKYQDICFHCTRVTVITRLCRAGYSEQQTMAYVQHASSEVHAIYQRLRPADVAHLGDALS